MEKERARTEILGANLRRIRTEKGVSRKELAEATGIRAHMIAEYETAKSSPPIEKIFALANALQTSIVSLTGDTEYNIDYPPPPDFDKAIFEYRFARAKKMLAYLDGLADLVGDEAFRVNDNGNITISVDEQIKYKDGIISVGGLEHIMTFKDIRVFVDFMEKAENRALYRQIPLNQALIELMDEAKK